MLKLFGKQTPPPGPKPRAPRDMLECSATLCTGQAFHRVRLIDVSKSGCKITVPDGVEVGKTVQIALEAYHSLGATIRWCREGTAGLQFSRPLGDTALVLWKKAVVEARSQPAMPADKRRRNFLGEVIAPCEPRRPGDKAETPRLEAGGPPGDSPEA